MKLNVIFKETQMMASGEETPGIALEHGWHNNEAAYGTDKEGNYYHIPMANVAYLQIPGGAPSLYRKEFGEKEEPKPEVKLRSVKTPAKPRKPKAKPTAKPEKVEWIGSDTANPLRKPMGKPKK